MLEVYVPGSEKPVKFRRAQSSEGLLNEGEDEQEEDWEKEEEQRRKDQKKVHRSI